MVTIYRRKVSCDYLKLELAKNVRENFGISDEIETRLLVWDKAYHSTEKFDYIIVSECLYYQIYHDALIATIKALMHTKSKCIIIAPKRGKTMDQFLEKVKTQFAYEITDKILPEVDIKIDEISKHPLFRSNEHKPYLITLNKSTEE